MGVLHGRDLLSAKWITAIISDASNRVHFVPMKHVLGDYFLTDIDGQTYAFKIDGTRILQYRESMVKTFRILLYDISHYLPISKDLKELEIVLSVNKLPKVDGMLSNIFRILGSREKEIFEPHTLSDLVAQIVDYETKSKVASAIPREQSQYSKEAMNMINYLDRLNVDRIITPLKKVSEFIQEDLKSTDPKFMGTVVSSYQRTDLEHKKVTNTPIQAKHAWMKFALIFMGIGMALFIGWFVYDSGMLDNLTGFADFGIGSISDEVLMQRYPDSASLKAAVDSGEISYEQLSPSGKEIYDEAPVATPAPPPEPEPEPEPEVVEEEEEVVEEPEIVEEEENTTITYP